MPSVYTWIAPADGYASTPSNWSPTGAPLPYSIILFNQSTKNCIWDINIPITALYIEGNASATSNFTLTLNYDLNVYGGDITIKSVHSSYKCSINMNGKKITQLTSSGGPLNVLMPTKISIDARGELIQSGILTAGHFIFHLGGFWTQSASATVMDLTLLSCTNVSLNSALPITIKGNVIIHSPPSSPFGYFSVFPYRTSCSFAVYGTTLYVDKISLNKTVFFTGKMLIYNSSTTCHIGRGCLINATGSGTLITFENTGLNKLYLYGIIRTSSGASIKIRPSGGNMTFAFASSATGYIDGTVVLCIESSETASRTVTIGAPIKFSPESTLTIESYHTTYTISVVDTSNLLSQASFGSLRISTRAIFTQGSSKLICYSIVLLSGSQFTQGHDIECNHFEYSAGTFTPSASYFLIVRQSLNITTFSSVSNLRIKANAVSPTSTVDLRLYTSAVTYPELNVVCGKAEIKEESTTVSFTKIVTAEGSILYSNRDFECAFGSTGDLQNYGQISGTKTLKLTLTTANITATKIGVINCPVLINLPTSGDSIRTLYATTDTVFISPVTIISYHTIFSVYLATSGSLVTISFLSTVTVSTRAYITITANNNLKLYGNFDASGGYLLNYGTIFLEGTFTFKGSISGSLTGTLYGPPTGLTVTFGNVVYLDCNVYLRGGTLDAGNYNIYMYGTFYATTGTSRLLSSGTGQFIIPVWLARSPLTLFASTGGKIEIQRFAITSTGASASSVHIGRLNMHITVYEKITLMMNQNFDCTVILDTYGYNIYGYPDLVEVFNYDIGALELTDSVGGSTWCFRNLTATNKTRIKPGVNTKILINSGVVDYSQATASTFGWWKNKETIYFFGSSTLKPAPPTGNGSFSVNSVDIIPFSANLTSTLVLPEIIPFGVPGFSYFPSYLRLTGSDLYCYALNITKSTLDLSDRQIIVRLGYSGEVGKMSWYEVQDITGTGASAIRVYCYTTNGTLSITKDLTTSVQNIFLGGTGSSRMMKLYLTSSRVGRVNFFNESPATYDITISAYGQPPSAFNNISMTEGIVVDGIFDVYGDVIFNNRCSATANTTMTLLGAGKNFRPPPTFSGRIEVNGPYYVLSSSVINGEVIYCGGRFTTIPPINLSFSNVPRNDIEGKYLSTTENVSALDIFAIRKWAEGDGVVGGYLLTATTNSYDITVGTGTVCIGGTLIPTSARTINMSFSDCRHGVIYVTAGATVPAVTVSSETYSGFPFGRAAELRDASYVLPPENSFPIYEFWTVPSVFGAYHAYIPYTRSSRNIRYT